jgi:A/G-specific adenine glycosylase
MNQPKKEEKKHPYKVAKETIPADERSLMARFRQSFRKGGLTSKTITQFRRIIVSYYKKHGRDFPWRQTDDPYCILVSEIMLQQTQVDRVAEKYNEFISLFPDARTLAGASLQEVLKAWLGLGYNRRAKALKMSAERIVADYGGTLPASERELLQLPGVGTYTAAAIAAFGFNQPVVLLETNVRTVFIHCFFENQRAVKDQEIIPLVRKTLNRSNPREWYNALMDYGAMLKKALPNPNRKSAHYAKQAPFEGSDRQIRGIILRMLAEGEAREESVIIGDIKKEPKRVRRILHQLVKERFIRKRGSRFALS